MVLFSDAFVIEHRKQIIEFAMRRGMPIISGWSVIADSGALCTYGPRLVESYRRVAYFVDRILKGAKPNELPIEQPTVLEFVVNLKTDFRYWHKTDLPRCPRFGRYRGESGHGGYQRRLPSLTRSGSLL
jgi:hypothetical protein